MKNDYEIKGDYVILWLYHKGDPYADYTIIDREDLEKVNKEISGYWHLLFNKNPENSFYVIGNKKGKTIQLHRFIMNYPKGFVVDHENGETLNNCKNNLRVLSKRDNTRNRQNLSSNNTSGVRGVRWCKKSKKWKVEIEYMKNNCRFNLGLGYYENFQVAEMVAKAVRAKYFPTSREYDEIVNQKGLAPDLLLIWFCTRKKPLPEAI